MKLSGCFWHALPLAMGAAVLFSALGCANIFTAKHRVLVDAIAAPGSTKPTAVSYRLLAKKSVVSNVPAQVSVIKACIDAALATKGMYEPPATVAPEIFIEVSYGVDQTPKIDAAARETFLQLSARQNADKGVDRGTGPELWDVRVAVLGIAGRMETAMPLLAAVAVDYMGTDTKLETKVEIPQNAPAVGAVRESAIKTLEAKAATAPKDAGGADTTPASASAAANAAVTPVTTK
jgi:hypothetical protein